MVSKFSFPKKIQFSNFGNVIKNKLQDGHKFRLLDKHWLSLFSLPLCTFFGHFLSNPPSKIRPEGGLLNKLDPKDLN